MSKKQIATPNLIAETFMSTLKIFMIILVVIIVINNMVWSIYVFKPTQPRIGDTHVEITQNGNHDIKQDINN